MILGLGNIDMVSGDQQKAFQRKLRSGERHLSKSCSRMNRWIAECGRSSLEIEWDRQPYESLVRAVAHQQLNGRAAATILQRFEAGFRGKHFPTPQQVSRADPELLRSMGLSAAKVIAIQGIAKAAVSGVIPTRTEAEKLSDEELIQRLITLRGVGQWTVEMLLIFSLGRLDVMPADDYGVKSGLRLLLQRSDLPHKREFPELTNHWKPYRSLAAWYLWRLADAAKDRDSP